MPAVNTTVNFFKNSDDLTLFMKILAFCGDKNLFLSLDYGKGCKRYFPVGLLNFDTL